MSESNTIPPPETEALVRIIIDRPKEQHSAGMKAHTLRYHIAVTGFSSVNSQLDGAASAVEDSLNTH